jgi:hypothetical protein
VVEGFAVGVDPHKLNRCKLKFKVTILLERQIPVARTKLFDFDHLERHFVLQSAPMINTSVS